jgi:hypothetical protein
MPVKHGSKNNWDCKKRLLEMKGQEMETILSNKIV